MARHDHIITQAAAGTFNGAGSANIVQIPNGDLYFFWSNTSSDVSFKKSSDGGVTWSDSIRIELGAVSAMSVWYDRWSGIDAGLIHVAWNDTGSDDAQYVTVDTENSDAVSTVTTVHNGTTAAANNSHISVTRARGGNVAIHVSIDSGAEGGFYGLANGDVPNGAWAALTLDEALATQDQVYLCPGFAADNQDLIMLFWDASANEISRKLYDDSDDSWGETSIATGMNDSAASSHHPHWNIFVDLDNSQIVMAAWSAVDVVNADLRCWTIDESTITELANIVTDSVNNQGSCCLSLDTGTGDWHVYYIGLLDGSETFYQSINIYKKISTDSGATWGAPALVTTREYAVRGMWSIPRAASYIDTVIFYHSELTNAIFASIELPSAPGHHQFYGG